MNSKLTNRLQFDGASLGNPGPMGIGAVLYEKGKIVDTITERLKGTGTNNVAEYTALLTGLERARERGWRRIKIQGDSDLIIKQVKGAYRVRSPNLVELYCRVMELLSEFESYELEWIPRELNELADSLSRESLGRPSSSGSRKGTGKNLSGGSRSKASHKGGNEGRGLGIEYDGILCPPFLGRRSEMVKNTYARSAPHADF